MTYLAKQYRCDVNAWTHRGIVVQTLLSKLTLESSFKGFQKSHLSPTETYLNGVGTAHTEITSCKRGRIRLYGSWWFALSNSNMTIHPGQKVRVKSRQNQTLLVEVSRCG